MRRCGRRQQIKASGNKVARRSGKINNFGNVCEIIAAECDNIWPPTLNRAEKVPVRFALQIDQTYRVARRSAAAATSSRPERLKPKINLRIHQTTRMNRKEFHFFKTRRGRSSSANIIAWKMKWTNKTPFILRILLGTRAYFSRPSKSLPSSIRNKRSKTVTGSVRCDSYVSTKRKFYG